VAQGRTQSDCFGLSRTESQDDPLEDLMSVKKRNNTTATTEERRFGEHLSAAVEAMRAVSSEIMQAREELNQNDFKISWVLIKVASEVKRLRYRLYRTGYDYWLEK
jgi:hypothetical protein